MLRPTGCANFLTYLWRATDAFIQPHEWVMYLVFHDVIEPIKAIVLFNDHIHLEPRLSPQCHSVFLKNQNKKKSLNRLSIYKWLQEVELGMRRNEFTTPPKLDWHTSRPASNLQCCTLCNFCQCWLIFTREMRHSSNVRILTGSTSIMKEWSFSLGDKPLTALRNFLSPCRKWGQERYIGESGWQPLMSKSPDGRQGSVKQ